MPTSQVTVAKESLRFSAAHFLTLPGHVCERLHGHNYRVAVTVDGLIDSSTGFVVDFAVLKRVVLEVIDPLDHRLLVPAANASLSVREVQDQTHIDYGRPGWLVAPTAHVCLVPVAQTTAEVMAGWMAGKVWESLLRQEGHSGISRLVLELEESAGQSAKAEVSA